MQVIKGNQPALPFGNESGVFNVLRHTVTAVMKCDDCEEEHVQTKSVQKLWNLNLDEIVDPYCPSCGIGECKVISSREE